MSTHRLLEVEYSHDEGVVIHLRPRGLRRVVPRESLGHWRTANREFLLAMRGLLDKAIDRMSDEPKEEQGGQSTKRQRVEVKEK